jgi:hypothetical protein
MHSVKIERDGQIDTVVDDQRHGTRCRHGPNFLRQHEQFTHRKIALAKLDGLHAAIHGVAEHGRQSPTARSMTIGDEQQAEVNGWHAPYYSMPSIGLLAVA